MVPDGSTGKESGAKQETQEMWVQSLGQESLLEKGKATHSSILAWRIPGTEEPGGLPSMGLQRVGHDRSDSTQGPAPCGVTSPGGRGGSFLKALPWCPLAKILSKLSFEEADANTDFET